MINYEEELKKYHPSMDVNEAEDAIYSRDLTDVTDILREMMKDEKKNKRQGKMCIRDRRYRRQGMPMRMRYWRRMRQL